MKTINTDIYLWIKPLVMNHQKGGKKVYFNCIVSGNHTHLNIPELEDLIQGEIMNSIMDFANIQANWDFGVISAKATVSSKSVFEAFSPKETKIKARVAKTVKGKKHIQLSNKNVKICTDGSLAVILKDLGINQKINFPAIWDSLETDIIGKIQEGDKVELTDNDGNILFELLGGSFLNVGLADLSIYDKNKAAKNRSLMNSLEGLKGGLFVREDGSIDVGDLKRTFYLKIYTNKLLKASLKINKTLNELIQFKLNKK